MEARILQKRIEKDLEVYLVEFNGEKYLIQLEFNNNDIHAIRISYIKKLSNRIKDEKITPILNLEGWEAEDFGEKWSGFPWINYGEAAIRYLKARQIY